MYDRIEMPKWECKTTARIYSFPLKCFKWTTINQWMKEFIIISPDRRRAEIRIQRMHATNTKFNCKMMKRQMRVEVNAEKIASNLSNEEEMKTIRSTTATERHKRTQAKQQMTGRKTTTTTKVPKQNVLSIWQSNSNGRHIHGTKKNWNDYCKGYTKILSLHLIPNTYTSSRFHSELYSALCFCALRSFFCCCLLDCCWRCANVCLYLCLRCFFSPLDFSFILWLLTVLNASLVFITSNSLGWLVLVRCCSFVLFFRYDIEMLLVSRYAATRHILIIFKP